MPLLDLPIHLATLELDQEVRLASALLFPEVVALHDKPEKLHNFVTRLAREIVAAAPPIEIHRRICAGTPAVSQVLVRLDPPARSPAWLEPLPLRFHVVRWRHADQGSIAFVPALDIHVVAARDDELDELIPRHIRFALGRLKLADKLFELIQLGRVENVTLTQEVITPDVRTPKRIAADEGKQEAAKPIIEEVGHVLSDETAQPAYGIDPLIDRISQALAGRNARSVLLIGPSGVGKTAAFVELFRQRRSRQLGHSPFWMTGGARLVAGQVGFGMWQERAQRLAREANKAAALVHLGNLVELMEVGKAGGSGFGIASFLRPVLARGDFLAVAECTPEQVTLIEKANPHLLSVFDQVRVEEPSPAACRNILLAAVIEWQAKHETPIRPRPGQKIAPPPPSPITDESLDELDRLHRRYATYSAAPGRPLRFLRNLLQDRQARRDATFAVAGEPPPISPRDVTAAFARETGLPLFLLDDATPLDFDAARRHFASRVIGQPEAVDLVTDLLATVKAALNRPRRPIASLLFIGPTGVGKTEMAKALAEYFFGDRARLVRFDMSEFATPAAVSRLVGSAWESEGLLTAKVREQPFCVVLLDEFEKAHPAFFDLLLQVLGEGRLTDSAGRLADFSNAIVVMTSNLGAQSFQSGPFGLSKRPTLDAREHFTDSVRSFLRPEMFNRIDRIVPFLPLEPETVRRIAGRELSLIRQRDGVRLRELSLDVSEAAAARLAEAGYDVLYGARPLKRRIERDLLAPLADAVNQYGEQVKLAASVEADAATGGVAVTVRAQTPTTAAAEPPSLAPAAHRAAMIRRRAQAVARSSAMQDLHNNLFQLRRTFQRKSAHPGRVGRYVDPAVRARIQRLGGIADAVEKVSRDSIAVEDELLLRVYEAAELSFGRDSIGDRLSRLDAAADMALLKLYSLRFDDPHRITVALFGESHRDVFALARAYVQVASHPIEPADDEAGAVHVGVSWFGRLGKNRLQRHFVDDKDARAFLESPRGGVIGLALDVHAPFAAARFEDESGLHVFEGERNRSPHGTWVDAALPPPGGEPYAPPADVEFRPASVGKRRRTYVMKQQVMEDHSLGRQFQWVVAPFEQVLREAMEHTLSKRTALIDG